MGKTIKLFENSSYITKFNATVLECQNVEQNDPNFNIYSFRIILDKTAFFPEGGGQPPDKGFISPINLDSPYQNTDSYAEVFDVIENDGIIYHYVNNPLEPQSIVECKIDWNFRFMLMQHHTGEHIVSGLVNRYFGLNNVGFHMGENYITVDFDGKLTEENLDFIERKANDIVYKNLGVKIDCPSKDELDILNYRSKKEIDGEIRVVSVPGADICACCGTHVRYTGEIGIIKFLSSQNYKGGTRVYILCGKRAFNDYNDKNKVLYDISNQLSCKPEFSDRAVSQLKIDRDKLRAENISLLNKLFKLRADTIDKKLSKVLLFEENLSASDLQKFASILTEQRNGAVLLFSGSDEDGYKYVIASSTLNISYIVEKFNETFDARGGGKPNFVQGNVKAEKSDIIAYFQPFDFNFLMNKDN
ncbi:MAG: alanyl-tRNA editing protein [Proteocatella sp.]